MLSNSFRLAILTLLILPILGCPAAPPAGEGSNADATTKNAADESLPVLGVVPWFNLIEPSGLAFPFEDLRGKIWIGGLLSAGSAEDAASWQQVQARLQEHALWPEIRMVSFGQASDTPESLTSFSRDLEADLLHWHFLAGSEQQLTQVTQRLGLGTSNLVLLDRLGRVRGSYEANDEGIAALIGDVEKLGAEVRPIPYPDDIMSPPWLEARAQEQIAASASYQARHDFSFSNRVDESGITFRNQATEDSGKRYKSNHYDHGNGLLVADVDGDGLEDIYFLSQLGGNELWRNLGEGRFENITKQAGVGLEDRVNVTGAFADFDNDGDPDLFVTTVRQGNVLFQNDGAGHFSDFTEAAGVGEVAHSSGAVFFDYDRDGLLDLLVTHVGRYTTDEIGPGGYFIGYEIAFDGHLKPERAERSTLFRNLGDGRFEDVSERMGLVEKGWNGDASLVDLDEDGWLDLYFTDMQGHDDVYRNVEGKRFESWREKLFPETPFGTMGIQVFDFDNDLHTDIFLTDMHTDMVRKFSPEEEKSKLPQHEMPPLEKLGSDGRHVRGNAFFHYNGGRFDEISDQVGAENYWPWGLSSGDLNADGFEDAFLASSMSYGWRYATNTVLLNEQGKRFVDSEFVLGVEPRKDHVNAIAWHSLDCSDPEEKSFLCKNGSGENRTGNFEVWGALGSRSSVIFDLDHDGDLDIVTNDFNARPMVLISDLAQTKRPISYLEVDLEGTTSNRDALGARVILRAGERSYLKVEDGNSGYLSFSPQPLYFGLGDATAVDRLEITWPSGTTQTVEGPITVNQRLKVSEPPKP